MTGEKKSSSELFYVQDLRKVCPACDREEDVSIHKGFAFYWGVFPHAGVRIVSMNDVKALEDSIASYRGTAILHLGDLGLMTKPKPRYKVGQPSAAFDSMDIDKTVSGCRRLFTNNLYEKIHDKIHPLPLGIYRKEIADFANLRQNKKEKFCYANFSLTNRYRFSVLQWAADQNYIDCLFTKRFSDWDDQLDSKYFSEPLTLQEFWSTLASYKFCIVPNGVGIDTERLWECIFMNVVPIVQNNYGNRIFSKIWPMILVDRYETSDIQNMATEFEKQYGKNIQYNHDLLLRENLPELLDRIEYECKRET